MQRRTLVTRDGFAQGLLAFGKPPHRSRLRCDTCHAEHLLVLSLPFPLRFLLATHPALIGRVLGIVYRVIAGHLIRQAGHTQQSARTGAVTLIQRFGSALNLNVHFHLLFLDGVYKVFSDGSRLRFQ